MRILTAEQMRAVDRLAIEELGLPGVVLMENAALGVVEAIGEAYPRASSAAVFCGPGNNGGDGLAVARHLGARGYRVAVWTTADDDTMRGDAALQLAVAQRSGLNLQRLFEEGEVAEAMRRAAEYEVVVDALFGTGLSRPLDNLFARLVRSLGEIEAPIVAVDLPSGLDASRSEVIGPHIEADLTVAFAAPKIAHVLPPAAGAVGDLVVADLGFGSSWVERADGDLWLLEAAELAAMVPTRPWTAHKGDVGHALVVGGSLGKSGAAVLSARAALRVGAGLVTVATAESAVTVLETASIETMTVGLAEDEDGLTVAALDPLEKSLENKTAWALGPGLGSTESTARVIRRAIDLSSAPLVVDADGLNAFAGRIEDFAERKGATILTPHLGELGRLLEKDAAELATDRLAAAREAAARSGSLVVVKGAATVIADPDGGVFVNPTGNPGMATGGTGDVLTGMICGFLAQGMETLAAAQLGVYLHGLAGDHAAAAKGEAFLAAGDLLSFLPAAAEELLESE